MAAQGPTASMLPIGFTEEDFWDIPWKSCYEPKWNEPEWGQNDDSSWLYATAEVPREELSLPTGSVASTATSYTACNHNNAPTVLPAPPISRLNMDFPSTVTDDHKTDLGLRAVANPSGQSAELASHAASHASGQGHKMAASLMPATLPYQTTHRDTAQDFGLKPATLPPTIPSDHSPSQPPPLSTTQNGLRAAEVSVVSVKKEIDVSSSSDNNNKQAEMLDLVGHQLSGGHLASQVQEPGNIAQPGSPPVRTGPPSIYLSMNPNLMPVPDSWRMAPLPMPAMRPIHIPDPPPNPTQITMSLYKDRNHKDNSTDGEPPCKRPCTIKEDQVLGSKIDQRRLRFLRTRYALEKSGLMEITMRTAVLLKSNNLLDQEISKLREETKALLEALMQNQQTNTVSDS